ncbi:MAG: Na+/H+ antiporter subunit D [Phycisphaeraceae bacterium]|nr:Na+/H+ antiporter subunit D [Phycisphaeraceae bacterium]
MSTLAVLPVILPLAAGAASVLLWKSLRVQRVVGVAATLALVIVSLLLFREVNREGIIVVHMGSWPSPIGISFVVDLFGSIMVVLAAITGAATAIYSVRGIDKRRQSFLYFPLLHILLMGVCGAFLTGDIFNLYVWFEVLLMSSFVLLALGNERDQLEGAIKYVTINLMSSALFLTAIGILYGTFGTLDMADLSRKIAATQNTGIVTTLSMLFLIAFGIKAAIFPLFFWLPASYHTPPFAVSAIFAGLLTKVGVYAIIRVFTLLFPIDPGFTRPLMLFLAAMTMLTGVLGAASQMEFRRVLSFHIISQIGYMLLGLALATPLALAGSVFYIMHHIIVKANLFFIAGLAERIRGTSDLKAIGPVSVYARSPLVAILFFIPAMSLAGIPPLSGFFAKLVLVRAGLEIGEWAIIAVALVVSILTLYSMTKIWAEAFWKGPARREDEAESVTKDAVPPSMLLPVATLAAITVAVGLFAGPIFDIASRAAAQLLDKEGYVRAVLGDEAMQEEESP